MIVRKGLAVLSWIALAVGMVWTGKAGDLASAPTPPPFPSTEVAIDSETNQSVEVTIEAASTGEAELRFAVEVADENDAQMFLTWLEREEPPELEVALRWNTESSPKIKEQRSLKNLKYIASRVEASRARWILHESMLAVEKGDRYVFRADISGKDADIVSERNPVFLLGSSVEVLPVAAKGPLTPGFVLLGGAIGVFIHLFMMWGRLMVPLRDPLPATIEDLI